MKGTERSNRAFSQQTLSMLSSYFYLARSDKCVNRSRAFTPKTYVFSNLVICATEIHFALPVKPNGNVCYVKRRNYGAFAVRTLRRRDKNNKKMAREKASVH